MAVRRPTVRGPAARLAVRGAIYRGVGRPAVVLADAARALASAAVLARRRRGSASAAVLAARRPAALSRSGYSYGYGPRPPRFRRRHPFRGAIIALVLFVLFGFVVRNITASHNAVSTRPFPSVSGNLATGRQAPPGTIGSHFDLADGSGNVYRVTLVRVIDPAKGADQFSAPDSGKRFVGLIFRVKALAGSPQNEDADNDAVVVGGNGQTYSANFDEIAGYTNFKGGAIHVAQGETVTGSVTFQVPNGVTVSRVRWTALSGFGSKVEWNVHG